MESTQLTFAELSQVVSEPLFSFPVILAPTIEAAILLPLSSPFGPACTGAFDFFSQKLVELIPGIFPFLGR